VYAFDLDQRFGARPGERFEVWGSDGLDAAQRMRLGSLSLDQKEQNRWVLKTSESSTLGAINTVYVTVTGAGSLSPTKPILRASF